MGEHGWLCDRIVEILHAQTQKDLAVAYLVAKAPEPAPFEEMPAAAVLVRV